MKDFDINSEEWKERLKGKSPEEIAEIVGAHYEEKYGKDPVLPKGKIIGLAIFFLIMVSILFLLYYFFRQAAPNRGLLHNGCCRTSAFNI
ncbi:MAG: hypothetical protein JW957_06845 [Candidatus Omnitrophica bacterium]|nr:hypothetical protein [Candidatus Omnitrophota bacterium]